MIYVLNYYNRKLTTQMAILYYPNGDLILPKWRSYTTQMAILYYPNGDLIKFKKFQASPIVVYSEYCYSCVANSDPDTVSDNDKVNEKPNVTLRINSSNDSLVKKFKVI